MKPEQVLIALVVVTVLIFVRCCPNDMTAGDSAGCLLTSQAILQEGTLALDAYPKLANPDSYKFEMHGEHVFYALGFGPALLSVPVVESARLCGRDMAVNADDAGLH